MRTDEEAKDKKELAHKQYEAAKPFSLEIVEAVYWIQACRRFLGDDSVKLISEEEDYADK